MSNDNTLPVTSIKIQAYPDKNGSNFLDFELEFTQWFTLLCGANGTGKSTALSRIKEQYRDRTILYNPIRNSERKNIQQKFEELERGGRRKSMLIDEFRGKMFSDVSFDQYNSFSDIVAQEFLERWKLYGKQKSGGDIVNDIESEYGGLVKRIFPKYKLVDWDFKDGAPYFRVKKYNKYTFNTDQLSTGEKEILSLVFNIYFFRESFDILLIDEPEIHLNWSLQENLLDYLLKFSLDNPNKKQVIVSTHSPVALEKRFRVNCRFLYYDLPYKKIVVSQDIPEATRKELGGEVVKLLISTNSEKAIYVEDNFHKLVLDELFRIKSKNPVEIQVLEGKTPINALFKSVENKKYGVYKNWFFLEDGDNQNDTHPSDGRYIKLSKYSLESFFMDLKIMSKISRKRVDNIKRILCNILNTKRKKEIRPEGNLYILGEIKPVDMKQEYFDKHDCQEFLDKTLKGLKIDKKRYIKLYLEYLDKKGQLDKYFDLKLVHLLNNL